MGDWVDGWMDGWMDGGMEDWVDGGVGKERRGGTRGGGQKRRHIHTANTPFEYPSPAPPPRARPLIPIPSHFLCTAYLHAHLHVSPTRVPYTPSYT